MATLRVTVVELPARWAEVERQLELFADTLEAGPPTDLVLLPEMSLTGYVSPELDFDLSRFAEPVGGPTTKRLAELARRHQTHLFGPLVLSSGRDAGVSLYNTTIGFTPDGEQLVTYRKRHPWIPEEWATAGPEPYPLFEVGGFKVTIACCYDVHFLADEAADTLNAADLLLFPSAWVEEVDSRRGRLRAIARRYGVAVVAANWGPGEVLRIKGQGGSTVLDAEGEVLASVTRGHMRADAVIDRR